MRRDFNEGNDASPQGRDLLLWAEASLLLLAQLAMLAGGVMFLISALRGPEAAGCHPGKCRMYQQEPARYSAPD